jgi:site-specific recombinase XerD
MYAWKADVIKHVTYHSFRHYVITALISEGWPYDQIQKITGHKSITTLDIYDYLARLRQFDYKLKGHANACEVYT